MLNTLIPLIIFVVAGCYFGWKMFMGLIQDGEVSGWDFFLTIFCYGFAVAAMARMGVWFTF